MKNLLRLGFVLGVFLGLQFFIKPVSAQTPYVGEIRMFGFDWCPVGWANADGQLLDISNNVFLFSLFGTLYGGNGRSTFALPDLRGRVPIHVGQGEQLPEYQQGQKGGWFQKTLTTDEMPSHTHGVTLKAIEGKLDTTLGGLQGDKFLSVEASGLTDEDASFTTNNTGGNQAFNTMPPYTTIRFCVAVDENFLFPQHP